MSILSRMLPSLVKVPVGVAVAAPAPLVDDDITAKAVALSQSMGLKVHVDHTRITESEQQAHAFNTWLAQKGLRTYDIGQVSAYLTAQYVKHPWGWMPLDHITTYTGARFYDRGGEIVFDSGARHLTPATKYNGLVLRSSVQYKKPIPYPVLLTIQDMKAQFPTARLYVNDEAMITPVPVLDPFLMVLFDAIGEYGHVPARHWIIERWDEPTFRG